MEGSLDFSCFISYNKDTSNCPDFFFSFFTFKFRIIVWLISDCLRVSQNQTKHHFLPLRAEVCLTALHHYLRQHLDQMETSEPFSSKISILRSLNDFLRHFFLTTYLPFNCPNGRSHMLARFRLHRTEIIDPMATFKEAIYSNKWQIDNTDGSMTTIGTLPLLKKRLFLPFLINQSLVLKDMKEKKSWNTKTELNMYVALVHRYLKRCWKFWPTDIRARIDENPLLFLRSNWTFCRYFSAVFDYCNMDSYH